MATKMTKHHAPTSAAELDSFLERVATELPSCGRLIFALDATQSRQPTWDAACGLQATMFTAATAVGNLEVQLVFFRGARGECKASNWMTDSKRLGTIMSRITCQAGTTQMEKVFSHAHRENEKSKIAALVFVGDAMEEKLDELCGAASRLGVPVFMFLEGEDETAEHAFREIAKITHGAFASFDASAANQLRDLLKAVAAFAAGGIQALASQRDAEAVKLLEQLR